MKCNLFYETSEVNVIEKRLKVKHMFIGDEILYNINDLIDYIKTCDNYRLQIGECIILPYYICNNKRMELYHYEFVFSDEYDFETFIKEFGILVTKRLSKSI